MSIDSWYGSTGTINSAVRAERTWSMILRDPRQIIVNRDGADREAQTVKITTDNDARWVGGDGDVGKSAARDLVIFGIAGHPVQTDTDLQTGDRFVFGDVIYEVRDCATVPGGIQAKAERQEG